MSIAGQTFRRLLKTGIANGAHMTRLDRLVGARRGLDRAPLVLGYHRVVEDFDSSARTAMPSMLVSTGMLEQHLDWVGQHYTFVSLDDLADAIEGRADGRPAISRGRPLAAVTFDDGYRDVYENAYPLLQRKGIPFAAYVVTDLVGTDQLQRHDEVYLLMSAIMAMNAAEQDKCWQRLDECLADPVPSAGLADALGAATDPYRATRLLLHRLDPETLGRILSQMQSHVGVDAAEREALQSMDWNMLREMAHDGVTIGSHTCRHTLLATAPGDVVHQELNTSRQVLEARLEAPVRHFAYPDGSFSEATIEAVNAAGYRTAVTTCQRENTTWPALTIPRRLLWERASTNSADRFSAAMLSCQVNGLFDGRSHRRHGY